VEIPVVMPKPDLTALTGGYRRTPVLQLGADVYCDSLAIARVLDELHPERPVFRPAGGARDLAAGRWFDQQLFLAGQQPGWADFCAFHPLWAAENNAGLAPLLEPHAAVRASLACMRGFGHGTSRELDAAGALAIARAARPRQIDEPAGPPLDGIALGDAVTVAAADYALEPSAGTLVHLGIDSVAIRRVDERAGEVVVHFPRIGFSVRRAPG
jgi:hypothetical protein